MSLLRPLLLDRIVRRVRSKPEPEKPREFKRLTRSTITDALIEAAEHADEMKYIVIVYETKDEVEDRAGGIVVEKDMTLSQINWLLDMAKRWLVES